jgi:hypothetical protein
MNPKEKAHDLICNFYFALPNNGLSDSGINSTSIRWKEAKQCALIAVDEILNVVVELYEIKYWIDVKTELTNL